MAVLLTSTSNGRMGDLGGPFVTCVSTAELESKKKNPIIVFVKCEYAFELSAPLFGNDPYSKHAACDLAAFYLCR